MELVLASYSAGITELKNAPAEVFEAAERNDEPVVVLSHNKPVGYIVPPSLMAGWKDYLEDRALLKLANARLNDGQKPVKVNLDDL